VRESVHPNLWDRWEHPGVEKGVLFLGLSKGYTPQFRMKAAATEPEDKQEKFPGTVVVGNGPESLVLKAVNPPTSKIIGHTQTKKPIYANPQHPSHARFTGDDHYDAHELHEKRMGAAQKLANQSLNNPSKAQYRQALKLRDAAKAGAIYHGKAAGVTGNYGYYNFG